MGARPKLAGLRLFSKAGRLIPVLIVSAEGVGVEATDVHPPHGKLLPCAGNSKGRQQRGTPRTQQAAFLLKLVLGEWKLQRGRRRTTSVGGGGSLIVPLSRLIVQLCGLPRDMVIRIPVHLVFPQDTKGWTMSGARTMTVLWALIPCR